MAAILLTGFEPFGGEKLNASWEAVRRLDGEDIGGIPIAARRLPVLFGEGIERLWAEVERLRPDILIMVGQAGGRSEICLERVAINIDDALSPDNAGNRPVDRPVIPGGPAAYFSDLPIKAMAAELVQQGIPARVSDSAGTFVCNHVFYGARHFAETRGPRLPVGLIHVPYLAEQAAGHPGAPSMSVGDITAGVRLAIMEAVAPRAAS